MRFLEQALDHALGRTGIRIEQASTLAGGCIHEARRLQTSEGDFFAKWSADAGDMFLREAEGLQALRSSGTEIVIPRVIAAARSETGAPGFLILEYLAPGANATEGDHERLGRGLAAIHRAQARRFGFPSPTYCGSTPQDNRPSDTWVRFYRERRLQPLVAALDLRGQLTGATRRVYERLMERLEELLPASAPASLIHGDLWSGNVLWTALGPGLVDPACAYADREMDFGIATLFGGLSERAMAAYQETWPLAPGWRDRNPLYQLYHLLNHAVLFGGSYEEQARRIAFRYGG